MVTQTSRPDLRIADALGELGVATVHEAQGRTGLLGPGLRAIWRPSSVAGAALTCVAAPGDNLTLHVALEQARPGDVLVVTPSSPCEDGYFDASLAHAARARGVRGVVIDAGVRDVAELTALGFPVWARAISALGTVQETPGDVQTPIVCAGGMITPGDVILADDDGVCVVPLATAEEVLAKAQARAADEVGKRDRYKAGELGLDMSAMRERLAAKGLRYSTE